MSHGKTIDFCGAAAFLALSASSGLTGAPEAGEVQSRLGVPQSRMTVCRPGAPRWSARERPPVEPYVLFVGTLEPRKNLGLLLDAYGRLVTRGVPVPPLRSSSTRGRTPPRCRAVSTGSGSGTSRSRCSRTSTPTTWTGWRASSTTAGWTSSR